MEPATSKALDGEQKIVHHQLYQAVKQINEADDLLTKNHANEMASREATALLLAAIARVFVVETAERLGMATRLPAFTLNKP